MNIYLENRNKNTTGHIFSNQAFVFKNLSDGESRYPFATALERNELINSLVNELVSDDWSVTSIGFSSLGQLPEEEQNSSILATIKSVKKIDATFLDETQHDVFKQAISIDGVQTVKVSSKVHWDLSILSEAKGLNSFELDCNTGNSTDHQKTILEGLKSWGKSLTKLSISFNKEAPQSDLSQLSNLTNLEELKIENTTLDNVTWLSNLPKLKTLKLLSVNFESEFDFDFSALAHLEVFEFGFFSLFGNYFNNPAYPINFKSEGLPSSIKALRLNYVKLLSEHFFKELTELEHLELGRTQHLNLHSLAHLSKIKSANFHQVENPGNLDFLKNWTALESLHLSVGPTNLEALTTLDNLTYLNYVDFNFPKSLGVLENNKNLTIEYDGRKYPAPLLAGICSGKIPSAKLKDTERPTYLLKTKKGDKNTSKCGGSALLKSSEEWPTCGNCSKPMPLFVQLDLAEVPSIESSDIFQLFYCNSKDPLCEVDQIMIDEPITHLLRVIPRDQKQYKETKPPILEHPITPKQIVEFIEKKDQPHLEDLIDFYKVIDKQPRCQTKDKVGGWPSWDQVPDWPKCTTCNPEEENMELLLQLNSDKSVAHRWGDDGMAHVLWCTKHKELHLTWNSG